MKKALIIGGGVAGCATAHQLTMLSGWDVLLVEAAPLLGAGVRTFWYGGHPYTFGPRHFLTRDRAVYDYMNAICPLRSCADHQFITYVEHDQTFYNFPIHEDDILKMPDRDAIQAERKCLTGVEQAANLEEYWIRSVGGTLYAKFIDKYSRKMWLINDNRSLDTFDWSPKGVAIKNGPRAAWDSAMSAYPYAKDGYNRFFEVTTERTTVLLNTRIDRYDIEHRAVWLNGEKQSFDLVVNTASPDTLFDRCYGELGYVGRDFHKIVFPTEQVFPNHVYFAYYANDEAFTRLVEYKKFTHHKSPTSLVGMEIPSLNGKHYPLPLKSEQKRARKYFSLMPPGVYSMGRSGSYRYSVDIAGAIEQAIELARYVSGGGADFPVPCQRFR